MAPYVYLALAILTEVIGTSALKFSDGFTRVLPSAITVLGYGSSFYLMSLSLKTLQVGFTYAVWSGVGMVLIASIGVIFMGEAVDVAGLVGLSLIIIGVIIVSGFSKMGGAG